MTALPLSRRAFVSGLALLAAPALLRAAETPAQFDPSLARYRAGDVVDLAPGTYKIWARAQDFSGAPLRLRSADPKAPARIRLMNLRDIKGLQLEGLLFQPEARGEKPFEIKDAHDITLRGNCFEGQRDAAGFGTGFALNLRGLRGLRLIHNSARGFYRGFVVYQSKDILVHGNDLADMSSDGLNFAAASQVSITNNHLHDFARPAGSKAHPDMIQFWTKGTRSPSRDIEIRGNLLSAGRGPWSQSIFMRNEVVDSAGAGAEAGAEMFYRNVTIADNLILNAHLHGITVGESDGLVIANNSVLRNARAGAGRNPGVSTPQITVAPRSRQVEITRNITAALPEPQPGWDMADNLILQDHARANPGFYTTAFGRDVLTAPHLPASFAPRPDGILAGRDIGIRWSPRARFQAQPSLDTAK